MIKTDSTSAMLLKLAKYLLWIGIIASLVVGILVFTESQAVGGLLSTESQTENYVKGILIAALGCLAAWLVSFLLKSFGKLVQDTADIRNGVKPHTGKTVAEKPLLQRMSKYWGFYLMFIPVLIFVAVFHYAPMFGIQYAFYSWKVIGDPVWVGFANFDKLFNQSQFGVSFWNTIEFSVVKLVLNTGLAVIISLLLNEMISLKFKKLSQTIIYLPHFMSWVVTASVFSLLLAPSENGLINQLLLKMGVIDKSIYFLADKGHWRTWYYIINLWRETGWQTIIFMATLTGIDPGIYEAASIDGAGRWKKMWYVTFPALGNTIITVLILNLAKIMNLFESVFVLQNDSVRRATNVLQTYVYYQTFNSGASADYGYTTAVGLFRSLVGLMLMLICNFASKKVRGRGIV